LNKSTGSLYLISRLFPDTGKAHPLLPFLLFFWHSHGEFSPSDMMKSIEINETKFGLFMSDLSAVKTCEKRLCLYVTLVE
jgi:hypothetical protein